MTRKSNRSGKGRTPSENHSGNSGSGSNTNDQNLTPLQKTLLEEADRKMRVRIDGKDQEISAVEAVLKKQVQTALSGSTHAQGQLLRSLQEAQEIKDRKIAEEVAHGHELKRKAEHHLKLRTEQGLDTIFMSFHPDDIIVTEGVGYEIKGPVLPEEMEAVRSCCAFRDLMYKQAVLEERLGPVKRAEHTTSNQTLALAASQNQQMQQTANPNDAEAMWDEFERQEQQSHQEIRQLPEASCFFLAHIHESSVPKRFHLNCVQIDALQRPLRRLKTRELLKEIKRLWQQNGQPKPRGFRMPPLDRVEHVFRVILSTLKDMKASDAAGTPLTEREIAMRLMKLND
jgi:hypothetical protein